MFIISEIVHVNINGRIYEAEIIDIAGDYAYVYVYDLHTRKNVLLANLH